MDEQDKKMLLDYFNKRYTLDGKVKAKDKIVKKERNCRATAEPKQIEVEEETRPVGRETRGASGRAEAKPNPKPKAEPKQKPKPKAEPKQKPKPKAEPKKIVVEDESISEDENDEINESSNVQQSEPIPIPVVKHQPRFAGFGSFF
jgi:hypothetical protein